MAYTGHGYHIPGTNRGEGIVKANHVTACGGPSICKRCQLDIEEHMALMVGEPTDYPELAKREVANYVDRMYGAAASGSTDKLGPYFVYIVWFSKTLRNWKGMLSTTINDGMYYEVTRNGEKNETYIDAYKKVDNVVIPD